MRLYNFPRELSVNFYEDAIERYVARVKDISGVKGVCTLGSVKAPGLSDIDIIVLVSDDFDGQRSEALSVRNIDDNLFIHGPIVIPESLVNNLQWIVFASNLDVLHGDVSPPSFSDLSEDDAFYLAAAYLIDFCESRKMQYAVARLEGALDVRAWHARIWSVTHSVFLAEKFLGLELTEWEKKLLGAVKVPRSAWLCEESISDYTFISSFDAAEQLNEALFIKGLSVLNYQVVGDKLGPLVCGPKKFYFRTGFDYVGYVAYKKVIMGRSLYIWRCDVPTEYFCHLDIYLNAMQSQIADAREPEYAVQVLSRRARLVKRHANWVKAHAARSGSLGGYLGLPLERTPGVKAQMLAYLQSYFSRRL